MVHVRPELPLISASLETVTVDHAPIRLPDHTLEDCSHLPQLEILKTNAANFQVSSTLSDGCPHRLSETNLLCIETSALAGALASRTVE